RVPPAGALRRTPRSWPDETQLLGGELVELQPHRHIGAAPRVAGFLEVAVVIAGDVPAEQDPAVLERGDPDVRPDRIGIGAGADPLADAGRSADVDHAGDVEAQVEADHVAPALDVVFVVAVAHVAG